MDVRTKQYFEAHAAQFDSLYHEGRPIYRAMNRLLRKAIYERFAITFEHAEPLAGKTVLDVGCGSGRYALEFARRGAARVLGLDFSAPMLELARQTAGQQGVADRCEFRQADFTSTLLDERFDVVIAIGVFDYQQDPAGFLRAMAAHCRGRLIASFPARNLIRMRLRALRYRWNDCPVVFYTEAEIRAAAQQANLARVELIRMNSSGGGWMLIGDV